MDLTVEDVRAVFRDVLNGRMTREAADRWAYSLIRASELGELVFVPVKDKECIWSGVMYLYGIDTMEAPGKYLHTDEDIQLAMRSKIGENERLGGTH